MKEIVLALFIFGLLGCSTNQKASREPSSKLSNNACTQGIQAFFDQGAKKEIGLISEDRLISEGLLREGEIRSLKNDPAYTHLILSEDEALREDTAKIVSLIRRYRPELTPKGVSDFYHKLFHSCKL